MVVTKISKLLGKYNKYQAGNQTARDFFWFYFYSIFQWNYLGTTFIVAGGNPQPLALNDNSGINEIK